MTTHNQQFQLPDGRKLGYDEHGAADSKPVFYLHGSPSSRLEARLYLSEDLLQSLGVRLIAVDRPGMGLSDFQPNRRLLDFPTDLLALADHLDIERFAILAYSLGGIHGLACARAIPERLTQVGIVSGAALFTEAELMQNVNEGTRKYLTLPRENPFAARLFLGMMTMMIRFAPKLMTASAASNLPAPDRPIVADSNFQAGFIRMLREALRSGTRGAFHESLLSVTDYGFRLQEIQTPIQLWHGEADQNVPVAMARFAASALPKCEAGFYPNKGHLSLFKSHAAEIVRALAS